MSVERKARLKNGLIGAVAALSVVGASVPAFADAPAPWVAKADARKKNAKRRAAVRANQGKRKIARRGRVKPAQATRAPQAIPQTPAYTAQPSPVVQAPVPTPAYVPPPPAVPVAPVAVAVAKKGFNWLWLLLLAGIAGGAAAAGGGGGADSPGG